MKKNDTLQIGITWGLRKETLKACTEALIVFLERLKRFDPRLGVWYEGGVTKKEALTKKVNLDYHYIKNRFCKNCDDNDYAELSFKLNFWNGNPVEALSYGLVVTIGGYKVGNNMIMFSFPKEGEIYEHYLIKDNRDKLKELFIDHWNPDRVLNDLGDWETI